MSGSTTEADHHGVRDAADRRRQARIPVLRETLVQRRHLLESLRQGRGRRLTLLSALGYGKTTLLAQWAAEDEQRTRFVWVSLDAGDADPVRLWGHVIRGLESVHPGVGDGSLDGLRGGPAAIISGCRPDAGGRFR